MALEDASYTTGMHLSRCDPMYCLTLGLCARSETIPELIACYFETPRCVPHCLNISVLPRGRHVERRGAFLRSSLEEIHHATMAAVARGIACGALWDKCPGVRRLCALRLARNAGPSGPRETTVSVRTDSSTEKNP